MPYKDKEKHREAQRESFRRRYAASLAFRLEEAVRKAEWLQTDEGKEKNKAATVRHRESKKAVKPKSVPQTKAKAVKAKAVPRMKAAVRKGG